MVELDNILVAGANRPGSSRVGTSLGCEVGEKGETAETGSSSAIGSAVWGKACGNLKSDRSGFERLACG